MLKTCHVLYRDTYSYLHKLLLYAQLDSFMVAVSKILQGKVYLIRFYA